MLEIYRREVSLENLFIGLEVRAAGAKVLRYALKEGLVGPPLRRAYESICTASVTMLELNGAGVERDNTHLIPRLRNSACACDALAALVDTRWQTDDPPHLWGANILSRPFDSTGLDPAGTIESHIPCTFNHVLQLQNRRRATRKILVSGASRVLDVRDEHLDIPVAAEPAFSRQFEDMSDERTAKHHTFDRRVLPTELLQNRDDAARLVLNRLLPNNGSRRTEFVLSRDSGALLEHFS